VDHQPAQCLACGELILVDWVLEHDQQRNEVHRLSVAARRAGSR
jgi:hypothetical protein